jgi:hypothetical protein
LFGLVGMISIFRFREIVCWEVESSLTLVGCSGTVPEEDPLQALVTLQLVLETESVVLVGELEEVWQERG